MLVKCHHNRRCGSARVDGSCLWCTAVSTFWFDGRPCCCWFFKTNRGFGKCKQKKLMRKSYVRREWRVLQTWIDIGAIAGYRKLITLGRKCPGCPVSSLWQIQLDMGLGEYSLGSSGVATGWSQSNLFATTNTVISNSATRAANGAE